MPQINMDEEGNISFEQIDPQPIDPLVAALTEEQIDLDIAAYLELLNRPAEELEVQAFLANHSYFFNGILRLTGASPLYSRVKLGAEYEVDFAFFDSGSYGTEWHLVEIESPSKRMFRRNGDPTAEFTHAIQQVRDWLAWVHENLDYVRKLMPQIEYPIGYVFMGRRADLNIKTRKKLRRIAHDHRMTMRIHTLDWFEGAARSVKNLIGRQGGWLVPMKAFSQTDLAARKPEMARLWLADETHAMTEGGRSIMQSERKSYYLKHTEYATDDDET